MGQPALPVAPPDPPESSPDPAAHTLRQGHERRPGGEQRSRWADVSLRTKITGVTVFILSLGLIVAGIGTQSALRPQLIQAQDQELKQAAASPGDVLGPDADTHALTCSDVKNAIGRFYIAVIDATGATSCDNSRAGSKKVLPDLPLTITPIWAKAHEGDPFPLRSSDGVEWRTIVIPVSNSEQALAGTLLISYSTAITNQTMNNFTLAFTGFSLAVLLLGAVLTRILVTNTFAPLFEVERTALEISQGDFSKRIMVASPHTEVGHLGQSLNFMLDRIDSTFDERARTIEQMRRFIGDAGHELRTPLVSVRGYAELYRMGALQDDEHVGQAMERIEKEAIRMTSLVEDLLALARLDERRPLQLSTLRLNQLAADTALDTMAQDPDRQVTVVEDPADPAVTGDEHKVRQVMTNLIGNALRYSPEGSPLEIAVASDPARGVASFEIIDHGEGIPEQFRHKIFDRFWRADNSRNRETGGSGLGLSIVQSIVAAHDGAVSAHETPGGGATFRVELPCATPEA